MKKVLWMLACGLLLTSGSVMAQMGGEDEPSMEDDIKAEVDAIFSEADGNTDGKVTKAELKKAIKAMGEWEDETSVDFLTEYGSALIDFLAADADDNIELTREELTAFYTNQWEGDGEVKLSKKDWDLLDSEYINPTADAIVKAVDTDGDGSVSKEESKAAGGDDFDTYDANKDGKVDGKELRSALIEEIETGYDVKRGDKTEATPEGEGETDNSNDADEVDHYVIYKTVGNAWTLKSTTSMAGMDPMVSYMKTEVLEVSSKEAKIKTTMMDKDKKETYSSESTISFSTASTEDGGEVEAPEPTEETIKVEAGEFECLKYVFESAGTTTTSWTSKKFPGLSVKIESKGEGFDSVSELVEWVEG